MRLTVTREIDFPDPFKLELYKRAPELGPRILFFSGGTALRNTSREIIRYTHNSIHLITPFDSGGSSAAIRDAFAMPAVGDIRNRLMALADQSVKGNPEIYDLFAHRLPKDLGPKRLREEIDAMAAGKHGLVRRIPDPMRKIIRNHLHQFLDAMPGDFNLKGASIGNLVLTAGYLSNRRQMDPVIYIFSKLAQVCGVVRPTINKNLHLAARLEDGTEVIGQHLMTGKEAAPLASPIADIWLTDSLESAVPAFPSIRNKIRDRIAEADLICYPPGSFYSSIIANLLPVGIAEAVAGNPCPKVFVPGMGRDPEAPGLSVSERLRKIVGQMAGDSARKACDVLDFVLLDSKNGDYEGGIGTPGIRAEGIRIIDYPLVTESSRPLINGGRLCEALASLT